VYNIDEIRVLLRILNFSYRLYEDKLGTVKGDVYSVF